MEQEETPECRICRCEGDEERPLFYPCACTGSIKWCHESCLVEWIKVSRSREYCETCGTQLSFKNIYSDATPTRLPATELTWLGFKRIAREAPYLVRASLVTLIWLVLVPIWSALAFNYLRPSTYEGSNEPSSSWLEWFSTRPSPVNFFTWESGVWILLAGFFWLFTLVSVFDFVRGFEMGEYAAELDALRRRQQQRVDQVEPGQEDAAGQPENDAVEPAVLDDPDDDDLQEDDVELQNGDGVAAANNALNNLVNGWNDNADAPRVNNNEPALDDQGGDHLGFDEWIGLRGPWCLVLNNVMCLCFCVLLFLVTFYVVPESLGRGVFRELQRHQVLPRATEAVVTATNLVSAEVKAITSESQILFPEIFEVARALHLSESTWPNISWPVWGPSLGTVAPVQPKCQQPNPLLAPLVESAVITRSMCPANLLEISRDRFEQHKYEAASVAIGLLVTMLFIQFQFGLCHWSWRALVSKVFRSNYPMRGCPHYVWKSVVRSTRTVARVQKVVCLLVFKMFAFPVVLGLLLDAALRPAIALSSDDRALFVADYPHLAAMLLWVSGITHTLLVTMNVIIVRDVLHHEVLDGIIRMRDPHGNQFLPLLVEPIAQQMKRTFVTCLIYTAIVMLFVHIPCQTALYFNLMPLPITVRIFSFAIQVPIESTLFHMWMVHVLEKSKPVLVAAQRRFFQFACAGLGLTEYLLPVPKNALEYQAAKVLALVRAGQLHWLDSEPRVASNLLKPRSRPAFVKLRLFVLLLVAWFVWFFVAFACVAVPYIVGVAAMSCLPALPSWALTDVRLYFVGWILLRYVAMFGPRAFRQALRVLESVSKDIKDSAAFALASVFLGVSYPILAGVFVFLETAFTDQDFPPERFDSATMITFLQVMMAGIPLTRAWLAGFPFVVLLASKTIVGRGFCRAVYEGRFREAGKVALGVLLGAYVSLLVGIFLGLEFWQRAKLTSSPLSTVRAFVFLGAAGALLPPYLRGYYGVVREACQRFHDKLKDDRYLMGRRLRNYDARVV